MQIAVWVGGAANVHAQAPVSLADLSIEQLVNMPVISTERMPTALFQSAAAVSVVTADDIQRMDLTTLPEALRDVPGLDVAQISASQWAVSSRGSNAEFANDTLVLSDGRSLYTDTFGGVFWKAQVSSLIDIDHIEVVRGPGASLWGANAVNGVVNIVTKSAFDTVGTLLTASEGTDDNPSVTARYGEKLGDYGAFRTELTYFDGNPLVTSTGAGANDAWRGFRADARADFAPSARDSVQIEAGYYDVVANQTQEIGLLTPPYAKLNSGPYASYGFDLLARWSRATADQPGWSLQADLSHDDDSVASMLQKSQVVDLNFQDTVAPARRQEIVWGTEFRLESLDLPVSPSISWNSLHELDPLYSAFVQDKFILLPEQLALIAGSKLEHSAVTGFELQPTLRADWTPANRQTLWLGISRAVRTPTTVESDGNYLEPATPTPSGLPVEAIYAGNPQLKAEKLTASEVGYRTLLTSELSVDLETFSNRYSDLIEYATPVAAWVAAPVPHLLAIGTENNLSSGSSWGGELSLAWQIQPHWRVTGDYSLLRMSFPPGDAEASGSPEHQAHLRSYWDLGRKLSFNGSLAYVSRIIANTVPVPAYLRCDFGVSWKPSAAWEFGIWGRNLLERRHLEFTSDITPLTSEIPRGFDFRLIWKH